jgi:hypothetical protein
MKTNNVIIARGTAARFLKLLVATVCLLFSVNFSFAQKAEAQRTLTVTGIQAIQFGAFCVTGGGGGTVSVGFDGSRTSTGNILLLEMAPVAQPAIFEIRQCHGRNVSVTFTASPTLKGNNKGSVMLDIGPTNKGINGSSFTTNGDCNFVTPLYVGGTLHIEGTSLPGNYTGSFDITVHQE